MENSYYFIIIILILGSIIVASCGGSGNPLDSNENPNSMNFTENEVDESNTNNNSNGEGFVFEEENSGGNTGEGDGNGPMVFEDEDGTFVFTGNIPPPGQWLITHQGGFVECSADLPAVEIDIPESPPEMMTLAWVEGVEYAFTLTDPSGGTVQFSTHGIGYEDVYDFIAAVDAPGVGEIIYYIDFNKNDSGIIDGSILNETLGCDVYRPFIGEYIGSGE